MSESEKIPYRLEEDPFVLIYENVVPTLESCQSVKQFSEQAISRHIGDVLKLGQGGTTLRKLTRRLNEVEDLTESIPKCDPEARWGSGNARKKVNPELEPKILNRIEQIDTNTGLSNSQICRICLYRHLFELARSPEPPFDHDKERERISRIWIDIEDSFWALRGAFHDILYRRFSLMPDKTRILLEGDLKHFEWFARVYREEFYEEDIHEEMTENYPERAFIDTENMIEELTSITFEEGFLQDYLDDLQEGGG